MSEISSNITNIVNTVYRARGTQAIQESRLVAQGIGGIGRSLQQTSSLSDRFNSQWRAIGTTMRYAIAGSVIFGLASMVSQLKDVQQQLGLIQAIGSPGGRVFSDQGVTRLGNQLQKSAQDALTPINEVNDATVNLLSTVQNVPESDIPSIITNIGQAAKLSQTPIEDLTKAATTMNIAFGRANNARTISQFTRMWFGLIQEAPGGVSAAPEIANQLAPLASMFALGQGPVSGRNSQAQMLGDVLAVLRTGSTPSTGLRGLTYLLQSIIQPTGGARKALAGIGITPQSIEREGVQANLMRLLRTITHTGDANRIGHMTDDQIDQLDQGGNLPGIPAAEMARLREMIPRIHGIRAAVILAGQLRSTSQRKSLEEDINLMGQEQQNQVDDVHNMARAWEDFRKRSRLQEATIAIQRMKLQVAQAFEPVLNLGANAISGTARVAGRHRTATEIAALGLAGIAGAAGLRRFFGISAGSGIARAEAIRDIGSPGAGNSPENPLYVIVVGQLFGGSGTKIPGSPVGPFGTAGREAEEGARMGRLARFGRAVKLGGPVGAGTFLVATPEGRNLLYHPFMTDHRSQTDVIKQGMRSNRRINDFVSMVHDAPYGSINPYWLNVWQQYMKQQISPQQLDKLLGKADVNVKVDISHDGKITTKRVSIPVDLLYKNGKTPSTRGKKAKRNG